MSSKSEWKKYYLICYDVVDTKQRTKLMKWLQNFGVRVQKSVFEAYIGEEDKKRMIEEAKKYIADHDSLRVYALSKTAYSQKVVVGTLFDYAPEEDLMI